MINPVEANAQAAALAPVIRELMGAQGRVISEKAAKLAANTIVNFGERALAACGDDLPTADNLDAYAAIKAYQLAMAEQVAPRLMKVA